MKYIKTYENIDINYYTTLKNILINFFKNNFNENVKINKDDEHPKFVVISMYDTDSNKFYEIIEIDLNINIKNINNNSISIFINEKYDKSQNIINILIDYFFYILNNITKNVEKSLYSVFILTDNNEIKKTISEFKNLNVKDAYIINNTKKYNL